MTSLRLIPGDCLAGLATLPDASVHCCVTSPPYWGLRDYGVDGQIGLEPTPADYVAKMVAVFRDVRRVLRDDGTLWLNLGDSYAREGGRTGGVPRHWDGRRDDPGGMHDRRALASDIGMKPKDLIGIPWRVAFALQADGWYLRSDIIWSKSNPMPESVADRPSKAHEYLFLLSKSERYHYVHGAVPGPSTDCTDAARTRRSVWTIPTEPFPGAHFAVMPTALVKPCILAGCPTGGTVLDPFGGSGTVAVVALEQGCGAILCELNPAYCEIIRQRVGNTTPATLLGGVA